MTEQAKVSFEGDLASVRAGLQEAMQAPPLCHMTYDDRATAELVLAEVLNNIVEHAYLGQGGPVQLYLQRDGSYLHCQVEDEGLPMQEGGLPAGVLPEPDALPEGGFGWFLIRSLARDLCYIRQNHSNLLSFSLIAD